MSYITDPSAGHLFLEGNTGGPVYPSAGKFLIVGSGVVAVTGDPALSKLTITVGGSVATSFTADSGVATPASNILNIAGGSNINTSATSNVVTINVGGLTPYAVQTGDSVGKLHSLGVGTNGQILVGNTGGYPTFYTLGTGNGVNSTIGAGTLSIGGITASTTQIGVSLLATDAEAIAGTDTAHNLTPSNLTAKLGTQTQYALPVGTGTTAAVGWLAVGATGEGLMGNTGANPGWTNSPSFGGSVTAATNITSTAGNIQATSGSLIAMSNSNDHIAADLDFKKAHNSAAISAGDELGNITFQGYDGANYVIGAAIVADTNGTPGTNRIPTQLQFWTHPDSTAAAIQRFTIASTGEITIATPDSGTAFTVNGNEALNGSLYVTTGNIHLHDDAGGGLITATNTESRYIHRLGTQNFFAGIQAGGTFLSGNYAYTKYNVGVGYQAGYLLQGTGSGASDDASYNTAVGWSSLVAGTKCRINTAIGCQALDQLSTGQNCTALGYGAGHNYTNETFNITIGSYTFGTASESSTLRIGTGNGSLGLMSKAYIGGIYGVTPGGTLNVALVDSNGQLGSSATLPPSLGGGVAWTTATGDATAAVNTGYLIKHATPASKLTLTLPATAAVYDVIEINGYTAGMWKLAQNASQVIHFNSIDTTTGTDGYLEATSRYDCLKLRCVVTNNEWVVVSSSGTITIV